MAFDSIPKSKDELFTEFRLLADKLAVLGLSPYEARAYIALIAHGYGNADVIAATAQIPRTSAYRILQSLENKGFAIGTQGRPKIFKPEPLIIAAAGLRVCDKILMLADLFAVQPYNTFGLDAVEVQKSAFSLFLFRHRKCCPVIRKPAEYVLILTAIRY